jgi:hypothetical protein
VTEAVQAVAEVLDTGGARVLVEPVEPVERAEQVAAEGPFKVSRDQVARGVFPAPEG